jgi:hypothetical protein
MRLRWAMGAAGILAVGLSLGSHIGREAPQERGPVEFLKPAELVIAPRSDCGQRETPEQSKAAAAEAKAVLLFDLRGASAAAFMTGVGVALYADRVLVWRDPASTGALPVMAYAGGCAVAGVRVPIGHAIEVARRIST